MTGLATPAAWALTAATAGLLAVLVMAGCALAVLCAAALGLARRAVVPADAGAQDAPAAEPPTVPIRADGVR